jgi:hypothetical protein
MPVESERPAPNLSQSPISQDFVAVKMTQDQTTTLEGVANRVWKAAVLRAKFIERLAEAERASEEQIKEFLEL